ncbi:MAG TPA: hypothetical protein VLT86_19475 [Vicinamibacterales bacterium]|nr:hypothetical protein [Vicinamibacterales bacterium]
MSKRMIWIGLIASMFAFVAISTVQARQLESKTTKLTFSQPVEVPGHVLPAGTYTFKMLDATGDRHIVQVLDASGNRLIALFMTIPDYGLTQHDETVIKFAEVPKGSTDVIRAWFYPGNSTGEEFVYTKQRAAELAAASNVAVPAVAAQPATATELKAEPVVAVTPEKKEAPVATTIQTTPAQPPAPATVQPAPQQPPPAAPTAKQPAKKLPKTSSAVPLIALLGFLSIAVGFGVLTFGKAARTSTR